MFDYLDEYYNYLDANNLTIDQHTELLKAQQKAANNTNVLKVIDWVFKYGSQTLDVLSKAGVIKNKNIEALNSINQTQLASLLAANGGVLNASPAATKYEDRSANKIFGLDQSTTILLGFALIAALLIFKPEAKK